VIHPSLAKSFGIKQEVVAAEIDWNALFKLIKRNKIRFTEIPQFPQVRRDLALLMDESVCCCDLRATAFKTAKGLLRQVGLFDVYRGKGIPEGKKQYAMSFVFRDDKRTLTDEEVERTLARLLEVFKKDYGVELR
jgi:phenylalanyl-tRNA synthetase beta chain